MKRNQIRLVTISQHNHLTRYGKLPMLRNPITTVFLCITLLVACGETTPAVTSTLIYDAVIHDGSGSEAIRGAVRIDGDRIVEIGEIESLEGESLIDAGGLVLAPGFIDTHNHHDSGMSSHRHMPGALSQGITTVVRGADGFSDIADEFSFVALNAFNETFAAAPTSVNIASYSPHNSIRLHVMGDDSKREATPGEVAAMAKLVAADMAAGAIGLATGLEYEPGMYSSTEELVQLASVAALSGGRYMSHLRDEDEFFMEAIDEIIRIGREAFLPVKISHIKMADRELFGTAQSVIDVLNLARSQGVDVSADIYPYEHWASDLFVLFPSRDLINWESVEYAFAHTGAPEDILITRFLPDPRFEGLTLAEIAQQSEKDPVTLLLDMAQAGARYIEETGHEGTWIIVKGMDDSDVSTFMQWEFTNLCSDGMHNGDHPRGHGAFPRFLKHYVRELGVMELPEAINKMTALSAASIGVSDRGQIRTGYFADLVLFDPAAIEDRATMKDSSPLSVGVKSVWVNGVLAFDNGEPMMEYPGRIVSRGSTLAGAQQ